MHSTPPADQHPSSPTTGPASLNDDGMLLWSARRPHSTRDQFATAFLQNYNGNGTNRCTPKQHINKLRSPIPPPDWPHPRRPTPPIHGTKPSTAGARLIGIVQHGVVYTGKTAKIAERRRRPAGPKRALLVAGPGIATHTQASVETTRSRQQSSRCSASPTALRAVRAEERRSCGRAETDGVAHDPNRPGPHPASPSVRPPSTRNHPAPGGNWSRRSAGASWLRMRRRRCVRSVSRVETVVQ